MTISPVITFGRNAIYRGKANYLAIATDLSFLGSGTITRSRLDFRVSGDGLNYSPRAVDGDLTTFTRSEDSGAFQVVGALKFGALIFIYGRLIDDGNNARCALFMSNDEGKSFNRLPTAIDGNAGTSGYRAFIDATVFSGTAVFLSNTGELAYTSDGISVLTRGNVGFTSASLPRALSIAAGSSFLMVTGSEGQAFSLTSPSASPVSRNLGLSDKRIEKVRAGNVLLAASFERSSVTSLTDPAGWSSTLNSLGSGYLQWVGSKWLNESAGVLVESPDGINWAAAAQNPLNEEVVRSSVLEPGRLLLFKSSGKIASTTDFTNWNIDAAKGLGSLGYIGLKVA